MWIRAARASRPAALAVARGPVAVRTCALRTSVNAWRDTNEEKKNRSDTPQQDFSDPFPLPFSPEMDPAQRADGINLASKGQRVEGVDVPIRDPNRDDESRARMIARLQYQCRKRGTLETDLILSTFALEELPSLPMDELRELDALLDEPDWDIFYWCTDRKPVPEPWAESFATQGRLGHRLRMHTRNDQRTVRRLPPLHRDIQTD